MYILINPIGLVGGNPTLYGYADDVTLWLDPWGFKEELDFINIQMGRRDGKALSILNNPSNRVAGKNMHTNQSIEFHYLIVICSQ